MSRRPFRFPTDELPFLDLASPGRSGPPETMRFNPAQIEQIKRTVRRTPEVMVKVTGGGKNAGSVAAHFAYISRKGRLEIETDEGERIAGMDAQRTFLAAWHLELSAGQYRGPRDQRADARDRQREVRRPAPLCDGAAHGSGPPARPPGCKSRGRARKASAHRQAHAEGVARGLRADNERAGDRRERDITRRPRPEQG